MQPDKFIPLRFVRRSSDESRKRASEFRELCSNRRTVRDYADADVPQQVIEDCIRTAGSAPSGANQQPWHFVMVRSPEAKKRIREAAEAEERDFYSTRASDEWLDALEPFGTDAEKPFLEVAPWLIAVFCQRHGVAKDGSTVKHYYATESVGIATGMLVTAIHHAGLASLTHTPSPMSFLNELLGRPTNERALMLLAVGYPADNVMVPNIERKSLDQISSVV